MLDYGTPGFGMKDDDHPGKEGRVGEEYGAYRHKHLRGRYDDRQEGPKRYVPILLLPLIIILVSIGTVVTVFNMLF